MKRAVVASIVDQGVLSAQSFLISFLLLRLADAEAVGAFALALSVFFLLLGAQNSLIGTPLMTRAFGRRTQEQQEILRTVCTFDLFLLAASGAATFLLLLAFRFEPMQAGAAALMVVSGLLRELARAVSIATGNMRACLAVDCSAVLLSGILLGALWSSMPPVVACLVAVALGNIAAFALFAPRLCIAPAAARAEAGKYYREYLALTRWSLLAAVSGEVASRTFLFLVELFRGIAAVGLMQIGRLLVSPLALLGLACSRIVMSRMAAHIRQGETEQAARIMLASLAAMAALSLAYSLALYWLWTPIATHLLGGRYTDIGPIVAGWCVYACVAESLRGLTWMFQAMERFRELALLAVAQAIAVIGLMTCLALPVPLHAALMVLTAGELMVGLTLVLLLGLPNPRKVAT